MTNTCPNCQKPKVDGQCPDCIITGVRLQILKPLNETWDDLGPTLRALRSNTQRVLNSIMVGLVCNLRIKEGGATEEALPDQYALAKEAVAKQAQWCRAEAERMRRGTNKRKAKDPSAMIHSLEQQALALDNWSTGNLSWMGQTAKSKFSQWMKTRGALDQWSPNQPILIRGDGVEYKDHTLKVKLRGKGSVELAVVPAARRGKVKGPVWEAIRQIADGKATVRDCKIVQDDHQWFAIVTVIRPRPRIEGLNPAVVMACKRGRDNLVYCTSNLGTRGMAVPGIDMLRYKQAVRARKIELHRTRDWRGKGARGHGIKRRHAAEDRLREQEANYCTTRSQQVGAAVVKACQQVGAGRLILEDWSTIDREDHRYQIDWPWYELRQCIEWAAHKAGIQVTTVPAEHICSTCPRCGGATEGRSNSDVVHCQVCNYSHKGDHIAALNMMSRDPTVDLSAIRKQQDKLSEIVDHVTRTSASQV